MRRLRMFGLAALLASASPALAAAAGPTQRFASDIEGVDVIASCRTARSNYAAEASSGVPLHDPYAVERGADKGLIALMNQDGRRVGRYVIARRLIRAVVALKYDMTVLDRTDLVFVPRGVVLVHTFTTNAGIFTSSDVYRLRGDLAHGFDAGPLRGDGALLRLLHQGIAFYRSQSAACARRAITTR